MGLAQGGVFGARRRCSYSGKLRFARCGIQEFCKRSARTREEILASKGLRRGFQNVPRVRGRKGKYGPNLGRSVRRNGLRLRYPGVSRLIRAHAGGIAGVNSVESVKRNHGERLLRKTHVRRTRWLTRRNAPGGSRVEKDVRGGRRENSKNHVFP